MNNHKTELWVCLQAPVCVSELVSCRIKITHEDDQARDNKERGAKQQLRDEDEDEDPIAQEA
jgi:hypothetical protein